MTTQTIAEIGMNHDGSLGNACKMMEAAHEAGADIVKFQTHIAEAETTKDAPMPPYFKGEKRFDYFKRTAFTKDQWGILRDRCKTLGVSFMSSPFSVEAVELLEDVGVEYYKVPSGEVTNLPLLREIAKTGKPVFISSGMSNWSELDEAVAEILKLNNKLTVMQCTSEYPCDYAVVGLNVMQEMKERYRLPVGFSDHTLTNYASFAATVLGASVIERHFTLSHRLYGSDARHSLEPEQFSEMVQGIRAIELMLGHRIDKNQIDSFAEMKTVFQKSVVALQEIPAGSIIVPRMLAIKKPGTGIPPKYIENVIGKKARKTIRPDQVIFWEDVE